MNFFHFESCPGLKYPTTELDTTSRLQHLSEDRGKSGVRGDDISTKSKLFNCQTETCTDLGEMSSISGIGIKREETVRNSVLL